MSRSPQFANPFYVVLILVGIAFVVTACGYAVLTTRGFADPLSESIATSDGSASGFLLWMDRYGLAALASELVVLAIATVCAIATDDFWERRHQRAATSKDKT